MNVNTIPNLVWVIYYVLFLGTILAQVYCIVKNRGRMISFLGLILCAAVVPLAFLKSMERPSGLNEFQYFFQCLFHGEMWTILIIVAYILIVGWWILFVCGKLPNPKEKK